MCLIILVWKCGWIATLISCAVDPLFVRELKYAEPFVSCGGQFGEATTTFEHLAIFKRSWSKTPWNSTA
jgi:hypothetical protein